MTASVLKSVIYDKNVIMEDFWQEKKPHKQKKDYKLWIMIGVIVLTVIIVMTFIFVTVPLWMDNWWRWLNGL